MTMETLLSACLGIGLAAACGFRIFVPLLVISVASYSGHLTLASGFEWIGSYPAVISFAVATGLEVAAYYVPWVDHALDTVAAPAAVIAGTVVAASMVSDMSPWMKWTMAAIAGGGAAGLVQAGTMVLRGASTLTTGGFGNPLVATVELLGATATAVLALFAPIFVVVALIVVGFFVARKLLQLRRQRVAPPRLSPA